MEKVINSLENTVSELYKNKLFTEIIKILDNKTLNKYKSASLNGWRARAHYNLNQFASAKSFAEKSIHINPNYWMGYLVRGIISANSKDYKQAIKHYTKAIELEPNDADLYNNRGNAYFLAQDFDSALNDYNKAIKINIAHIEAYVGRGNVLASIGNYQLALEAYDYAISQDPKNDNAYANRGNAWYALQEFDKALGDFSQAIKLNVFNFNAYSNRSNVYFDLGQYDKAILDCNLSIKIFDGNAEVYNNRANAYYGKGDYDKALLDYNKAIQLKPSYAMAYFNRGNLWNKIGNYKNAFEDYSSALESDSTLSMAYNNRGYLYMQVGDFEKAIEDFKSAIKYKVDSPVAYRNIGDILVEQEKESEAFEYYELALEFAPQNAFYRKLRDELALKLGHKTTEGNQSGFIPLEQLDEASKELSEDDRNEFLKFYYDNFNNIIDQIKEMSLQIDDIWKKAFGELYVENEAKWVAHYTSLKTADTFVMKDDIKIRYSNAVFMNDPQEGRMLVENLNFLETGSNKKRGKIWEVFNSTLEQEPTHYYIGSFMPVAQGHEDELLMWRTYGKDENYNEAAGCSVAIDVTFFDKHIDGDDKKTSLTGDKSEKGIAIKQPLHKMFYYNQRINQFVNEDENKLNPLLKQLVASLTIFIDKKKAGDSGYEAIYNKAIDKYVYHVLNDFRYLFKSSDYAYESELRIVQYSAKLNQIVKIDEESDSLPRKLYIESNKQIRPYIRQIVLGPKVQYPTRWMYLEEKLKDEKVIATVIYSQCRFQ